MTAQDWFNSRQGQSLLVPGQPEFLRGQCVQAMDFALNEIYGLPFHYGNAVDWWNNPKELLTENFEKISDGSVQAGDFVIYDGSLPGSEGIGHIDLALQNGSTSGYTGADSNWGGNLTVHQVVHSGSENKYILGSLRMKGDSMSQVGEVEFHDLFEAFFGPMTASNQPTAGDRTRWIGAETNTVIREMQADPRTGAWDQYIQDLIKAQGQPSAYKPYDGPALYEKQ